MIVYLTFKRILPSLSLANSACRCEFFPNPEVSACLHYHFQSFWLVREEVVLAITNIDDQQFEVDDHNMMKVSDLFIKCLETEGVEYIFGMSGEETNDIMMSLLDSKKIKFILVRHEQAGSFYGRCLWKIDTQGWSLSLYIGTRCNKLDDRSSQCQYG